MKRFTVLVIILVLITGVSALPKPPKPKAKITRFDIDSLSLRDITFLFDVEITNPYPLKLKLDSVDFTFYVEKNQFLKTTTSRGLSISAWGRKTNQLKVNIKYEDIMKVFKAYGEKDYLACQIHVAIAIPLPDITGLPENIVLDYDLNTRIPAIKPNVSVADFTVRPPTTAEVSSALAKTSKKADAGKITAMFGDIIAGRKTEQVIDPAELDLPIDVNFDIVLKNETKAKLLFSDLKYDFFVGNEKLVNGTTRDIVQKDNVSNIHVKNRFSSKSLSKSLVKVLYDRKGNFTFKGNTQVKLPDDVKKTPVNLAFDEGGNFGVK